MGTALPVAVIGGGPAGAAAAIELLGSGYDAIVFERSRYDEPRIGESVPPPARQLLAELGIAPALLERHGAPSHGIWCSWGADDIFEKSFILSPYGHGWHVDRRALDEAFASEATARGAEFLRDSKLVSCQWDGDRWWLRVQTPSGVVMRPASFLIDASGRAAIVGAITGARRATYDRLVAVARLFRGGEVPEPVTFVEAVQSGWWYAAPLPDGALMVVYLTDADLDPPAGSDAATRFMDGLAATRHLVRRTAGLAPCGAPRVVMADTYRVLCPADGNWINAGAAAIGIDPLSSDGICFALGSGRAAALTAVAHLAGNATATRRYAAWLDDYFARYLSERREFYAGETRWPASPFWSWRVAQPAALQSPPHVRPPRAGAAPDRYRVTH